MDAAAVETLRQASDAGDGEASRRLAALHANGFWSPFDWSAAMDRLQRAEAQGSIAAAAERRALAEMARDLALDRLMALPERIALCERPRVRSLRGFVSPGVAAHLIARARGRLAPASTVETDGLPVGEGRTNSAFAFGVDDTDCVVALVRRKTAAGLRVPVEAIEPPQVLHYAEDQEYRLHVDYLPEDFRSQRIATFLVYLNDGFEGGETHFPRAGLKARAATGGAVYFANVDEDGRPDPLSLHAGLPPARGEKWLLSQWIHDRPYGGVDI